MKTILFVIILLSLFTLCYSEDYWAYVCVVDGNSSDEMSGDFAAIITEAPNNIPTISEGSHWAIFKADMTQAQKEDLLKICDENGNDFVEETPVETATPEGTLNPTLTASPTVTPHTTNPPLPFIGSLLNWLSKAILADNPPPAEKLRFHKKCIGNLKSLDLDTVGIKTFKLNYATINAKIKTKVKKDFDDWKVKHGK